MRRPRTARDEKVSQAAARAAADKDVQDSSDQIVAGRCTTSELHQAGGASA
jgi:hypothetical protein